MSVCAFEQTSTLGAYARCCSHNQAPSPFASWFRSANFRTLPPMPHCGALHCRSVHASTSLATGDLIAKAPPPFVTDIDNDAIRCDAILLAVPDPDDFRATPDRRHHTIQQLYRTVYTAQTPHRQDSHNSLSLSLCTTSLSHHRTTTTSCARTRTQ